MLGRLLPRGRYHVMHGALNVSGPQLARRRRFCCRVSKYPLLIGGPWSYVRVLIYTLWLKYRCY